MRVAVSILALGIMLSVAGVPGAEAAQPINVRLSGPGIPLDPTSGKVSCEATAAGNDDAFHEIYLKLYDPEGRLLNEDYAEAYGDVRAYVESDPTTTGEYRCTADFYTDREYVWTANGYPSIYLFLLDITVNTFIPDNHYPDPRWWCCSHQTGEGDDRWFSRYGSSRTWQELTLIAPAADGYLITEGPVQDVGMSALYEISTSLDGNNRLTAEAKNDWSPGPPLKLDWGKGSGATLSCSVIKNSITNMTLECHGNEATPLFWWAPGITYDFYIDFWFYTDGRVEYLVRGQHDGFPNYEMYVGNHQIFSYNYWAHGQTIWSLGPPAEFGGYFVPGEVP